MSESSSGDSIVLKEVEEYLSARVVRRRLFPRAILVGLIAGTVAVVFRLSLSGLEHLWFEGYSRLKAQPFLVFAFASIVGLLGTRVALMFSKIEPDSSGSGIPQTEAALEGSFRPNWIRILWTKFLGSLAALGAGLALGREGPTVQMGGAVGHEVAVRTNATARERRALTAAGAGAGLAAAFNAPLAGVTFVLEELQRDFQAVVFAATLLCAAVATVVSRLASGQVTVFSVPFLDAPPLRSLVVFVIVGCLGGFLGVLFNRSLLALQELMHNFSNKNPWLLSSGIGLLLGLGALVSPLLLGGGHDMSEAALAGQLSIGVTLLFLVIRFLLVNVCYGTGVPGGIFAPLLSLGALLGLFAFHMAGLVGLQSGLSAAAVGVAGMCALFSGVVRAPLTGVILIGEMTGSYDLLLPLLIASFCAYMVADGMNELPIYEALLLRFSASREISSQQVEQVFARYIVPEGCKLVGKNLRDAGLPAGVLVVMCTYDGKEFVPSADTVLLSHMRISVILSSDVAASQLEELIRG